VTTQSPSGISPPKLNPLLLIKAPAIKTLRSTGAVTGKGYIFINSDDSGPPGFSLVKVNPLLVPIKAPVVRTRRPTGES
jgi:hypothetical protein